MRTPRTLDGATYFSAAETSFHLRDVLGWTLKGAAHVFANFGVDPMHLADATTQANKLLTEAEYAAATMEATARKIENSVKDIESAAKGWLTESELRAASLLRDSCGEQSAAAAMAAAVAAAVTPSREYASEVTTVLAADLASAAATATASVSALAAAAQAIDRNTMAATLVDAAASVIGPSTPAPGARHEVSSGVGSFELVDASGTPSTSGSAHSRPLSGASPHTPSHSLGSAAISGLSPVPMPSLSPPRPPPRPPSPPPGPKQAIVEEEEWRGFFDHEGRISDWTTVRARVFYGGVAPELRREVWPYLLGVHRSDSTAATRAEDAERRRKEYISVRSQWESISEEQSKRFAKFRDRRSQIDKDVVRTDRQQPLFRGEENESVGVLRSVLLTYSFYNFDLGYCQGMSDLLAPILVIMGDESEAFWCFASLMESMEGNFHRDQNGMHSQLLEVARLVEAVDPELHAYFAKIDALNYFFCFRWILIIFKREFAYPEMMRLWESLWSRHLGDKFHLLCVVSLLRYHKQRIIDSELEFDTLLQFVNQLAGKIELHRTLRDAELLYGEALRLGCL